MVPSDGAEGTWAQRTATLETIRKVGQKGWQRESGYRRQGAVENLFFRYKRTLSCGWQGLDLRFPQRNHQAFARYQ